MGDGAPVIAGRRRMEPRPNRGPRVHDSPTRRLMEPRSEPEDKFSGLNTLQAYESRHSP
jgi:hypothetical protein